jgi:hypothetical protein
VIGWLPCILGLRVALPSNQILDAIAARPHIENAFRLKKAVAGVECIALLKRQQAQVRCPDSDVRCRFTPQPQLVACSTQSKAEQLAPRAVELIGARARQPVHGDQFTVCKHGQRQRRWLL